MNKKIRWAICGLGTISKKFLDAINKDDGSEIVACVSSSKERANKYGDKFGIENRFTYEELVANADKVDAVYVCTFMSSHRKNCIDFMNAGIAVLCEKSVTTTLQNAEDMIACAKENGVLFMEGMWTRLLPATLKFLEIAHSGELGKVKSLDGSFEVCKLITNPKGRVLSFECGGGVTLDLAVYCYAFGAMLCGKAEKIEASGKLKNGVDSTCISNITYENGVTASYRSSVDKLFVGETMSIEFEKGSIKIPNFYRAIKFFVKDENGKVSKHTFDNINGFIYQLRHFNALIAASKTQSDIIDFDTTLEVMRVMDTVLKQVGVHFE